MRPLSLRFRKGQLLLTANPILDSTLPDSNKNPMH